MVGGTEEVGPKKKYVVEPIPLTPANSDAFLVNLADTGGTSYLRVNVALALEPMASEEWYAFSGKSGGGHGAKGDAPGPPKVATYPKFFDAIQTVGSGFTAQALLQPTGKQEFKRELLDAFAVIAETDAAERKASADAKDPLHVGPPYHVQDVFITTFTVKP
jgi:flagellar basal body-associated protein FliL